MARDRLLLGSRVSVSESENARAVGGSAATLWPAIGVGVGQPGLGRDV